MKKLMVIFSLLLTAAVFCQPVFSQNDDPYLVVENMPSFQGGDVKTFVNWVASNIVSSEKKTTQGKVTISFIIEKDGAISNVEILRGINSALDKAVLEAVNRSPDWEPGSQRSTPVRVKMTAVIEFPITGTASGQMSHQSPPANQDPIRSTGNDISPSAKRTIGR